MCKAASVGWIAAIVQWKIMDNMPVFVPIISFKIIYVVCLILGVKNNIQQHEY